MEFLYLLLLDSIEIINMQTFAGDTNLNNVGLAICIQGHYFNC